MNTIMPSSGTYKLPTTSKADTMAITVECNLKDNCQRHTAYRIGSTVAQILDAEECIDLDHDYYLHTMNNQLSLFGSTPDQSTFQSTLWGCLMFYPTGSEKWTDNCRHCLLWKPKHSQQPDDECLIAPCKKDERTDNLNGYYSIHQMPNRPNRTH